MRPERVPQSLPGNGDNGPGMCLRRSRHQERKVEDAHRGAQCEDMAKLQLSTGGAR